MAQPVVESLAKRREKADAKPVNKFTGAPADHERGWGWANQRWIRVRTATAGLDAWTTRFAVTYRADAPGTTRYSDMAGAGADAPLPSYSFVSRADRTAVNNYTVDLVKLAGDAPSVAVSRKAPRPCQRLRLVPDDETADGPDAETDTTSIDLA